jgi:hypothetical protein
MAGVRYRQSDCGVVAHLEFYLADARGERHVSWQMHDTVSISDL